MFKYLKKEIRGRKYRAEKSRTETVFLSHYIFYEPSVPGLVLLGVLSIYVCAVSLIFLVGSRYTVIHWGGGVGKERGE